MPPIRLPLQESLEVQQVRSCSIHGTVLAYNSPQNGRIARQNARIPHANIWDKRQKVGLQEPLHFSECVFSLPPKADRISSLSAIQLDHYVIQGGGACVSVPPHFPPKAVWGFSVSSGNCEKNKILQILSILSNKT